MSDGCQKDGCDRPAEARIGDPVNEMGYKWVCAECAREEVDRFNNIEVLEDGE